MLNLLTCLENSNKWAISNLSTFLAKDPAYASLKQTKKESDFLDVSQFSAGMDMGETNTLLLEVLSI